MRRPNKSDPKYREGVQRNKAKREQARRDAEALYRGSIFDGNTWTIFPGGKVVGQLHAAGVSVFYVGKLPRDRLQRGPAQRCWFIPQWAAHLLSPLEATKDPAMFERVMRKVNASEEAQRTVMGVVLSSPTWAACDHALRELFIEGEVT